MAIFQPVVTYKSTIQDRVHSLFYEAAATGNLNLFKALYEYQEHAFDVSNTSLEVVNDELSSVVVAAFQGRHFHILKYLHSKNMPFYCGANNVQLTKDDLNRIQQTKSKSTCCCIL